MQKLILSTVAAATILLGASSAFAVSDVNDEASRAFLNSPQSVSSTYRGGADLAIPGPGFVTRGNGSEGWLNQQHCDEAISDNNTANVVAYCGPGQQ